MQIEKISLDKLKPYENNAKKHTAEQIEQIKNSIRSFGNNDPLGIAGADNVIYIGNGRYTALKELGYKEAYCIRLDHLTEKERKAYAIAHNKLTMNTGFDEELLRLEFEDLQSIDFDLELTGFDVSELDEIMLNFVAGTEDEQGDLSKLEDKKEKTACCPNCGEVFKI